MNRIMLEREGAAVTIESKPGDLNASALAWLLFDAMCGYGYSQKSVVDAWSQVVDEMAATLEHTS